jgi:hypothetical protein
MARVTRSTKIAVAEDESSIYNSQHAAGAATQPSMPETRPPLEEINNTAAETISIEDLEIAEQAKALKAAYKSALGIKKKGKKGRRGRKAAQSQQESGDLAVASGDLLEDELAGGSAATLEAQKMLNDDSGSLMHLLNGMKDRSLTMRPAVSAVVPELPKAPTSPAVRATRRQLRGQAAQAGQYNHLVHSNSGFGVPFQQVQSVQHPVQPFYGGYVPRHVELPAPIRFGWMVRDGVSHGGLREVSYSASRGGFSNSFLNDGVSHHNHNGRNADRNWRNLAREKVDVDMDEPVGMEPVKAGPVKMVPVQTELGNTDSDVEMDDAPISPASLSSPSDSVPLSSFTTVTTLDDIEKTYPDVSIQKAEEDQEDSFIEKIVMRSPAKPVSRIEDSVEELDKMEEILEALDEAALAEKFASPEKQRKRAPRAQTSPSRCIISPTDKLLAAAKESRAAAATKSQTLPKKPTLDDKPPRKLEVQVKKAKLPASRTTKPTTTKPLEVKKARLPTTTPRPASVAETQPAATKRPLAKRPLSLLAPKEPLKSSKPVTRPARFELPGEAIARRLKEQREARISQRASSADITAHPVVAKATAPKIKSTKAPTKPATFELPGEALSRKKREAHEARLKAQEEEEKRRREFKAKPLKRASIVPSVVPRETAASLARRSLAGMPDGDAAGDGKLTVSKRASVVSAHRPSMVASSQSLANASAPRAHVPGAANQAVRKASTYGPSMSGLQAERKVSVEDVQAQRQRAKDIYRRDARAMEEAERERREKEDAARKAREEAAERGRQASREWAERMMRKKMAGKDEGLAGGFGPGGQLGLKP